MDRLDPKNEDDAVPMRRKTMKRSPSEEEKIDYVECRSPPRRRRLRLLNSYSRSCHQRRTKLWLHASEEERGSFDANEDFHLKDPTTLSTKCEGSNCLQDIGEKAPSIAPRTATS